MSELNWLLDFSVYRLSLFLNPSPVAQVASLLAAWVLVTVKRDWFLRTLFRTVARTLNRRATKTLLFWLLSSSQQQELLSWSYQASSYTPGVLSLVKTRARTQFLVPSHQDFEPAKVKFFFTFSLPHISFLYVHIHLDSLYNRYLIYNARYFGRKSRRNRIITKIQEKSTNLQKLVLVSPLFPLFFSFSLLES